MNINYIRLRKGLSFEGDVDFNFERTNEALRYVEPIVPTFVDASAGAVSKYLPDGASSQLKQYLFVKTDSSANAVTIYPFDTQLIDAGASTALAAQGDSVHLVFDRASQTWWSI